MKKLVKLTKIIFLFIIGFSFFTFPSTNLHSKANWSPFPQFFISLFGENVAEKSFFIKKVYIGGSALGFTLLGDGVVVIGLGEVQQGNKNFCPSQESNLKSGDILIELDNIRIENAETINNILDLKKNEEYFDAVVLRNGKRIETRLKSAYDDISKKQKLGLWIRDNAAGVGTLTYVCENGRFGALGHPVCDIDTGTKMPVRDGNIFPCNVVGIQKATAGKSGELRGLFLKNDNSIGSVIKNCEFGIFGKISDKFLLDENDLISVANKNEIKPGKAQIVCQIDGSGKQFFDIEIIKANYQVQSKSKSMVLRVVDNELIEKTGGIVQGMSGSPIIQNNKLVGAVTHVFVSDATKGYGVYAEWMLEQ